MPPDEEESVASLQRDLQEIDQEIASLEKAMTEEWCITLIWRDLRVLRPVRQRIVNRLFVAQEIEAHREELEARGTSFRIVIEVMPSPLQRDQYVLTLGCGHLKSYNGESPPALGSKIDCIHCRGPESVTMDLPGVRQMDSLVRELRIARGRKAGLLP